MTTTIIRSDFSASLHPKADVAYEPPSSTYFHAMLDEETWVLILINLRNIEAIIESHIACFVNIIPVSLIAYS